ncbi:glutathione S-transferase [Klebsiella michiganensis]|uniref:Glutathione S-transferase n=1 Tax=Klebsiella michiganensis TaxID=1134687 RepID=A0A7H4PP45_9ENTR|nr:glutathione S-transferase [Klebsiella michiganensis]
MATKITLFLEEAQLAYRLIRVDIGKGEQFHPQFLAISPNNKIPAIVDHAPADGGGPLSLFESGAILLYLAEKNGKITERRAPRAPRHPTVVILAGRRVGADARTKSSLQPLCSAGCAPTPLSAIRWKRSACMRAQSAPWRESLGLAGQSLQHRRYRLLAVGECPPAPAYRPCQFPGVHNWFERIRQRPATVEALLKTEAH